MSNLSDDLESKNNNFQYKLLSNDEVLLMLKKHPLECPVCLIPIDEAAFEPNLAYVQSDILSTIKTLKGLVDSKTLKVINLKT